VFLGSKISEIIKTFVIRIVIILLSLTLARRSTDNTRHRFPLILRVYNIYVNSPLRHSIKIRYW